MRIAILELSRKYGRIVQAGHLERFNPAVTAAREQSAPADVL